MHQNTKLSTNQFANQLSIFDSNYDKLNEEENVTKINPKLCFIMIYLHIIVEQKEKNFL